MELAFPHPSEEDSVASSAALRLLGLSLAGMVAVPVGLASTRPSADEGSLSPLARPMISTAPLRVADAAGTPIPSVDVHSARLSDLRPAQAGPVPVRVWIESVGVDARVVPVGVEGQAGMAEVPEDVGTVGWYRFGPSPGADGSSLLIGHVDSRVQGPGAFYRLSQVHLGQRVVIRFADGSRRSFEVIARRSYPKDRLPTSIFTRSGRPSVALVTCGGSFDPVTRSYSDNVVVFAVPLT